MIKPKYIELIHREIDGENSPNESARLKEYLVENKEARLLYEELAAASRMLSTVQEVEPSSNLKKRILNGIQPSRYAPRERATLLSGIKNLTENIFATPSHKMKYAYTFAFGLLAGVIIYSVFVESLRENNLIDISDFYGTISQSQSSGRFVDADRGEINLPEVSGSISTRYSKDLALCEVTLHPLNNAEVVLEFDESQLAFNSFMKLKADGSTTINTTGGSVRLSNFGNGAFVFVFIKKDSIKTAAVNCKIFSNGKLLYENSFAIVRDGQ